MISHFTAYLRECAVSLRFRRCFNTPLVHLFPIVCIGHIFFVSTIYCSTACIVLSNISFFSWHSHMTITFHPMSSSCFLCNTSFLTFLSNFSTQNSVRVLGVVAYLQPSCRCQKQPFIKIAVLYFGSTTSGFPGYLLSFFLNRNPLEKSQLLTCTSILVSLPFIRLIFQLRCSFETISAILHLPVTDSSL